MSLRAGEWEEFRRQLRPCHIVFDSSEERFAVRGITCPILGWNRLIAAAAVPEGPLKLRSGFCCGSGGNKNWWGAAWLGSTVSLFVQADDRVPCTKYAPSTLRGDWGAG